VCVCVCTWLLGQNAASTKRPHQSEIESVNQAFTTLDMM